MIDTKEFVENMERIYEKIKKGGDELKRNGSKIDPIISKQQGCPLVVLKPNKEGAEILSDISRRIGELWPGVITYPEETIHMTVATLPLEDNFQEPYPGVMARFVEVVDRALKTYYSGFCPIINFSEIIFNPVSVLMAGRPPIGREEKAQTFFYILSLISRVGEDFGLELKAPWGMHSTINRSYQETPASDLSRFFSGFSTNIMSVPYEITFDRLVVDYHTTDENGLIIHPVKEYCI